MATSCRPSCPDQRQDRRRPLGGTRDYGGCIDHSRWQASGYQQTTPSHLPPVGRQSRGCGHLLARPSKEEKANGVDGAGWLLYASSGRITDHCNTEDKRGKCRASNPDACTGGGKSSGGTCRACRAGAVEETLLRHIILRFEAVSIYNFDVSL